MRQSIGAVIRAGDTDGAKYPWIQRIVGLDSASPQNTGLP